MTTALKEWAVTVRALASGDQVVTLRKGGIREPDKHFDLTHRRFFLYPTFDHQRLQLVRPEYQGLERASLADGYWDDGVPSKTAADERVALPSRVTLRAWAQVAASYELTQAEDIEALTSFHIWTSDYANKRLKWKPRHPLQLILLRTYWLEQPRTIECLPRYSGCMSWLELEPPIEFEGAPVLSDQEFQQRRLRLDVATQTLGLDNTLDTDLEGSVAQR